MLLHADDKDRPAEMSHTSLARIVSLSAKFLAQKWEIARTRFRQTAEDTRKSALSIFVGKAKVLP
jgi:hypothetical protein